MVMYGFGHDPEVPAGFQDADIEMAEMREAADEAACRNCRSTGWIVDSGTLGGERPCPVCNGTGIVVQR